LLRQNGRRPDRRKIMRLQPPSAIHHQRGSTGVLSRSIDPQRNSIAGEIEYRVLPKTDPSWPGLTRVQMFWRRSSAATSTQAWMRLRRASWRPVSAPLRILRRRSRRSPTATARFRILTGRAWIVASITSGCRMPSISSPARSASIVRTRMICRYGRRTTPAYGQT
jgi:hypothetical protein